MRSALRRAARWQSDHGIPKVHETMSNAEKAERKMTETLHSFGARLQSPEEMKKNKRKMKELEKLGLTSQSYGSGAAGLGMTGEQDQATYMRSKKEKFNITDGKFGEEIKEQKGNQNQKKARDIAMGLNPFEGNPIGGFMDYVENEQDYFQRGQTQQQSIALSRERARSAAKRSAAEARTTEMLGPVGVNTLKAGKGAGHHSKLLVSKFDMNSFTFSDGKRVVGSTILLRDSYFLWDVASQEDITMEKVMPLAHLYPVPNFIILGLGASPNPPHPDVLMYLRSRGTRVNFMSTEAAIAAHHQCRTDDYPFATALLCPEPTNGFDYYSYNQYWKKRKDISHGLAAGSGLGSTV